MLLPLLAALLSSCAFLQPQSQSLAAVTAQASAAVSVPAAPVPAADKGPALQAADTAGAAASLGAMVQEAGREYDISLMAVGDNLLHMGIVNTGRQSDGSYDFSFLFETIQPYIDAADIRIINQETIFGGDQLGFSGFPAFNSPTAAGDAIIAAGFNVVLHATNHAADQGLAGIQNCAAYWAGHPEVLMTGIRGEASANGAAPEIPLLTVDGVTFAVLNYTYGPNAEILDASLAGHLNMLCSRDPQTGLIDFTALDPQVLEDIARARGLADIVIVCPHWGTEYATTPSTYQRQFAAEMAAAGADLIIGTHPHVPQPVEWIESEDGRRTLCYYSLGNYVSTQKQAICMLEEMAWVTFHVSEDGVSIRGENTGALPLVCHYTAFPVRLQGVYPLTEYTEAMAEAHGIRNYGGVSLHLAQLQQDSQEILGDMMLTPSDISQ